MATTNLLVTMKPTKYAKLLLTQAMFTKGTQFLAAAILLKQRGGYHYVVLHLVCQGMEIMQKALLLAHSYDTFKPQIAKRALFGHDLIKGADAVSAAYGLQKISGSLRSEVEQLNHYYMEHLLRYASSADILIDGNSISYKRALKRCCALVRFGFKKIRIPVNSPPPASPAP
jgi:hypothetical protein